MQSIVIVDYGLANLRSVQKAFEKLGFPAVITSDPQQVREADKVVLPGVGAFRDAIAGLHQKGLAGPVVEHVRRGKPFFGICLGLQMLFTVSREDGEHRGLDLFPGEVVRFTESPGLKIPHMGWNQLRFPGPSPLFEGVEEGASVYFVHSYYCDPEDPAVTAATSDHGGAFCAALSTANVHATQFHPEKSGDAGAQLLENWVRSL